MAQVGLIDPTASPVDVETTTGDGMYRYRLHANGAVAIDKRTPEGGWEPAYRYVLGACNCLGFEHRGDCKHADLSRGLCQWWLEHRGQRST